MQILVLFRVLRRLTHALQRTKCVGCAWLGILKHMWVTVDVSYMAKYIPYGRISSVFTVVVKTPKTNAGHRCAEAGTNRIRGC